MALLTRRKAGFAVLAYAFLPLVAPAAPAQAESLHVSIVSAEAGQDPLTGLPIVALTLTAESAAAFSDFTAAHVGDTVSILVDGKVMSSPVIRTPIPGGEFAIHGSMTEADAKALAEGIAKGIVSVDIETD